MARKPKPEPDDPKQSKRFVETARTLEVDETGKAFMGTLKKIIPKRARRTSKDSNTAD